MKKRMSGRRIVASDRERTQRESHARGNAAAREGYGTRSVPTTIRDAFTAIELLAASTLAAIMTVAVSGILGGLSAHRAELNALCSTQAWQRRLARQLEWDLANARQCESSAEELNLTGLGGRDFVTGLPTQRPAQITYRVRTIGDRSWLIRRETHLDDLALHNWREELVCVDIDRIEFEPMEIGAGDPTGIPRRARLRLRSALTGDNVVDEAVYGY